MTKEQEMMMMMMMMATMAMAMTMMELCQNFIQADRWQRLILLQSHDAFMEHGVGCPGIDSCIGAGVTTGGKLSLLYMQPQG